MPDLIHLHHATATKLSRFGARLAEDAASEAITRYLAYDKRVTCPGAFCYITGYRWCLDEIARWERRCSPSLGPETASDEWSQKQDFRDTMRDLCECLSPREIDAVRGLLLRETSPETACRLGLKPTTVRRYRGTMRKRARAMADLHSSRD